MAIGILEVSLVGAKSLAGTDFLGRMDPYVVIKYKSQERRSSVARGQGGSPSWNEKHKLRVEYPGEGNDYKLILRIMDEDTFSADDFVGEATHRGVTLLQSYVKDLLALGVDNGTAELHPRKYSVTNANQCYCGEIQVGLNFTLKEVMDENDEEKYGGWNESEY
ncbi:hypothetical protein K2173_020594 [Erythroxylum novogranatense]|uniref:C2 domain-containing protein n=1 Tax=Erythroxylum novogranatense TaxID=1862640 RepID=A0AAV8TH55_9ROSI|nr:hypothetical protein K2173_020594 [Erythroxylum novogranatense]